MTKKSKQIVELFNQTQKSNNDFAMHNDKYSYHSSLAGGMVQGVPKVTVKRIGLIAWPVII